MRACQLWVLRRKTVAKLLRLAILNENTCHAKTCASVVLFVSNSNQSLAALDQGGKLNKSTTHLAQPAHRLLGHILERITAKSGLKEKGNGLSSVWTSQCKQFVVLTNGL